MRLTKEQLNELMRKEGVDRLWSWSKWHCFKNSCFEYYLKYIMHKEEDRATSIYTTTGGISHEILEKYYTGECKFEEMLGMFEDGWLTAFDIAELKFDRNNETKNDSIAQKYYENLKHFFMYHTPIQYKPHIEKFVKAKIGGHLFQGYIDAIFVDGDGCYNIIDFKTSSIYKGEKAEDECGQLVVYAIGLNQAGIPWEKIKIAWCFLKYTSIQYTQKNGEVKTREVERAKIGESLQANAKTWLKSIKDGKKRVYTDEEVDEFLKQMIDTNGIECLPEEVREKYVISDCYVYVPLTEKLIKRWTDDITTTITDILLREADYQKMKAEGATEDTLCRLFWDTDEMVQKQSYYFSNLCSYSPMLHLPYKQYLERLEAQKNGDGDMFGGIGSGLVSDTSSPVLDNVVSENATTTTSSSDDDDLSWIDDL